MAREVTIVELYGFNRDGEPRSYTIASSAAVAIGTYMKFADARLASASTGTSDIFGGFVGEQHDGKDFSTRVSLLTNGIFEGTASGGITAGDKLATAAPGNYVMALAANTSSHAIVVGVAQEDASAGEKVTFRTNI